jgi:uncharacterized protein (DUF305 family)
LQQDGKDPRESTKGMIQMNLRTRNSLPLAAVLMTFLLLDSVPPAYAQHKGHGNMDMKSMMREHGKMMNGMKLTGDADVDFAMMMRMHHLGGIKMAEHQLEHGKDSAMKEMARKIVESQKKEVAEFERFLAQKGHSTTKATK